MLQPFQNILTPDEHVEYVDEMRIFDLKNLSWHACEETSGGFILQNGKETFFSKYGKKELKPEPRYGLLLLLHFFF